MLRNNPSLFTRGCLVTDIVLDYVPRVWQAECHRQRKRFKVLALHRRAGKTELGVMELIDNALLTQLEAALFVYMAPYLRQAKGIAWDRIKHYARQIPGTEVNESELWVKFAHNGAKIQIFGGDNPDGLRGLRLDGCVIDEVAQVKPEVWNEVVQPALSDRKGWALFIGTPHGINMFSDLFYKAQTLPDWSAASYTVFDTDALDPAEVARLQRDMPENEFAREYLCDFSAAAESQLLSLRQLIESTGRLLRRSDYELSPKVMGVDVARFGDDRSVIMVRQGLYCSDPITYQGLDNMEFASRVIAAIKKWEPAAVFIDIGNGSGVVDRLRQLGYDVTEVNFGSKASSPIYVNKRTEMWYDVKQWVESGGVIPNDQQLKQDLAAPTYKYNAKNQIQLESKDDIKKRIMRSPDSGDALALTFAWTVYPKRSHPSLYPANNCNRVSTDYNPHDGVDR